MMRPPPHLVHIAVWLLAPPLFDQWKITLVVAMLLHLLHNNNNNNSSNTINIAVLVLVNCLMWHFVKHPLFCKALTTLILCHKILGKHRIPLFLRQQDPRDLLRYSANLCQRMKAEHAFLCPTMRYIGRN